MKEEDAARERERERRALLRDERRSPNRSSPSRRSPTLHDEKREQQLRDKLLQGVGKSSTSDAKTAAKKRLDVNKLSFGGVGHHESMETLDALHETDHDW
mmetsp:Transcript_28281/g.64066  ORF Transcript_28281/g.64066 Transcript_28281/m.64066 type:complete len:100 (-) Transcript_28281:111-410(-)